MECNSFVHLLTNLELSLALYVPIHVLLRLHLDPPSVAQVFQFAFIDCVFFGLGDFGALWVKKVGHVNHFIFFGVRLVFWLHN